MKIREHIGSGVLEAFVLGAASKTEAEKLMRLKKQYPEIDNTLAELEADMERMAQYMAVPPTSDLFMRIENRINHLVTAPIQK